MSVNLPSIGKTILNLFGWRPREKIMVFNPTPYAIELSALGSVIDSIPSSGTLWGDHFVRFNGEQYPLIAWVLDGKKRIGVSFAAPSLFERQIGSWVINQIYYPDGRYSFYNFYWTSPFGNPDLPGNKKVNLPGTALGTTIYVQIINCTHFDAEVRLGTGYSFSVPSMEDVTLPYENVLRIDGSIPYAVNYIDRGRVVGWSSSSYSVWTNNTPRAVQILLLPSSIQRAPY